MKHNIIFIFRFQTSAVITKHGACCSIIHSYRMYTLVSGVLESVPELYDLYLFKKITSKILPLGVCTIVSYATNISQMSSAIQPLNKYFLTLSAVFHINFTPWAFCSSASPSHRILLVSSNRKLMLSDASVSSCWLWAQVILELPALH